VRHLVQQDLVDFVIAVPCGQVPRHGDALEGEVAQARTLLRVVEVEGPAGVEVQGDQRIRPASHSGEVGHQGATCT
jgi:hypothetical protein